MRATEGIYHRDQEDEMIARVRELLLANKHPDVQVLFPEQVAKTRAALCRAFGLAAALIPVRVFRG